MFGIVARAGAACLTLILLAVGGLRLHAGTTTPLPAFDAYHRCGDVLCWHTIHPGTTPIDDVPAILTDAGFTRITPVEGDVVVAGWSVDEVNNGVLRRPLFDDSIVNADGTLMVSHIRLAREVCSHSVLAQWGRPDDIVGYPGNDRWLSYIYYTDHGTVLIFHSEYGNSVFTIAELMTERNYRTYRFLYGNGHMRWTKVRHILEQPC
ncbi:MAG: hypothetical protein AAF787_12185 [Chloroflexota bacterium]